MHREMRKIFREEITEEEGKEDINFSYKLNLGRSDTRNALFLLKLMGYPSEVVENAQALAQRFSGASRGASIGHVSPEAADGGPIAFVEEGDIISINIPEMKLDVKVSDEEMAARKAKWQPREAKVKTGYLARYKELVTSGAKGAVMKRPDELAK